MRVTELLTPERVALHIDAKSKEDVLQKLIDLQMKSGAIKDREEYRAALLRREGEGSTAVGMGIAVPHAKSAAVSRPVLSAAVLNSGVDYGSPGGEKSDLFFIIAAPENGDGHLEILSKLMALLMDEGFAKSLRAAKSPEEFIRVMSRADVGSGDVSEKAASDGRIRILAVTACPTGIAHTFMAAEALEKAAVERGISIKVETNGSGGVKNGLKRAEIENCDGIIVAADKNVETGRFNGKPVLFTGVSEGIHRPGELIEKIESGSVPVFHSENAGSSSEPEHEGVARQIYKHLMGGVSHMLPFVIGGGILIALAFLLDDYSIDPSNFGMNTPAAAFFKTVGGAAFNFMLPVLAGFIAYSIADRPGLAVGFVGGYIANVGSSFANITGENAVSGGFLAALLAGFAAGYFVLFLRKITEKMPKALDGLRPILIYPLAGILGIGVFMYAINPVMGVINTGLENFLNSMGGASKILLGCVLGGMMSVDMGGPINKAAYVFGTASIAAGGYDIMAAVMVGGMIPPLAIAVCSTFFRRKFTDEERKSGLVNYVMGLCFISEGAIPFAAADPLRVIPSCVVGSAVAGGLSMFFGCTLRAPHGGIFVFPVVGHVLGYCIALAAGSVAGALMLAALKRNNVKTAEG